VKQSSEVNDALVILKIIALCIFIVAGALHIKTSNFSNLFPNGLSGVISGAALIFFAYIGYARVATISEEVENPEKTIPLSILISLGISTILYLLVSFTAVGVVNYNVLSVSGTPLADAMKLTGNELAMLAVSLGAIFATSSVLLTTILGVSRITFSMARNKQIPSFINSLHPKFQTPHISIMLTGLLMAALALFGDLKQVFSLASFAVILTHILVNYSAIKLRSHPKFKIPLRPIPPILGIVSCSALLFFLPFDTWIMAGVVLFLGVVFYFINKTMLS
jgi:APA family basic amino acid/polyamine antiporter